MNTFKKICLFLAVALIFAAVAQASGYIGYLLNKGFILANMDILPFHYRVFLGFGQWTWWSFLLSGTAGVLTALAIL